MDNAWCNKFLSWQYQVVSFEATNTVNQPMAELFFKALHTVQVMELLEKPRDPPLKHILLDTPG